MTAPAAPTDTVRKKTILLVDDESAITLLYELELTRRGYYVLTAHSGKDACRISADFHSPIDVLITDWHMPNMSGDELARQLIAERPNLKVILTSGDTAAAEIAKGFSEDRLVFLGKPISHALLNVTIYALLAQPLKPDAPNV